MSFTMFDKVGEAAALLPEEDRRELYASLCEYGFTGKEPQGCSVIVSALFATLREDIDNSKAMREQGNKGGRPKKPQVKKVIENQKPPVIENQKPPVIENQKPPVIENQKPPVIENQKPKPNQTKPNQTKPLEREGARAVAAHPPTPAEVEAYVREWDNQRRRGHPGSPPATIDGERFCDYYGSNGWKVGKNAMKDWHAAARGWVRRDLGKEADDAGGYDCGNPWQDQGATR